MESFNTTPNEENFNSPEKALDLESFAKNEETLLSNFEGNGEKAAKAFILVTELLKKKAESSNE